jgi:hypothetical protein
VGRLGLAGPKGQLGQGGGGGAFREEAPSLRGHAFLRGAQVHWVGKPFGPNELRRLRGQLDFDWAEMSGGLAGKNRWRAAAKGWLCWTAGGPAKAEWAGFEKGIGKDIRIFGLLNLNEFKGFKSNNFEI